MLTSSTASIVTLGQSAYSYRSTGYTLQVDDVKDGSGRHRSSTVWKSLPRRATR